jgi:hypothetical protein
MQTFPRLSDITKQDVREQQSIDFMKYLSCLADTRGAAIAASHRYLEKFPDSFSSSTMRQMLEKSLHLEVKAAIAPGTSTDAVWAKPLVGIAQLAAGFLAIAHSQSLLGRIAGLQEIPFNTKVPYQTAEANFVWLAESGFTPTSKLAFTDGLTLAAAKVLGIVVLTEELVRLSRPGPRTMRKQLISGLNAFVDKAFLDPASTAIAGQRPASITAGTTPVVGTADFVASVKALITAFFAASPATAEPVLVANGANAAAIRGQVPGFGLPVYASEAALTNVVILDPSHVFYADGGLEVDYSREAALEMSDAPLSPTTAAAVITSLWQSNLVGYRMLRFVSFGAAPNAVKYMTTP